MAHCPLVSCMLSCACERVEITLGCCVCMRMCLLVLHLHGVQVLERNPWIDFSQFVEGGEVVPSVLEV